MLNLEKEEKIKLSHICLRYFTKIRVGTNEKKKNNGQCLQQNILTCGGENMIFLFKFSCYEM